MNPYILRLLMSGRRPEPEDYLAPILPTGPTNSGVALASTPWDQVATPGIAGTIEDRFGSSAAMPSFEARLPTAAAPAPPALSGYDQAAVDRRARRESLGALGIALLSHAAKADYAGGLAEGFAGMAEARNRVRQEEEAKYLRQRQDARAERENARQDREMQDRLATSELGRKVTTTSLEHQQGEWGREDTKREGVARTAKAIAESVARIAGAESPEAKEAAIEAANGPDADLGHLHAVHDQALGRARFSEDAKRKTQAEIEAEKAKAAAGYGDIVTSRRAERQLGLDAERNAIYRESVQLGKTQAQAASEAKAFEDDVRAETNTMFGAWLDGRMKQIGQDAVPQDQLGAWIKTHPNSLPPKVEPPSQAEIEQQRQRAEALAITRVRARRQDFNAGGASGSGGGRGAAAGAGGTGSAGGTGQAHPLSAQDKAELRSEIARRYRNLPPAALEAKYQQALSLAESGVR